MAGDCERIRERETSREAGERGERPGGETASPLNRPFFSLRSRYFRGVFLPGFSISCDRYSDKVWIDATRPLRVRPCPAVSTLSRNDRFSLFVGRPIIAGCAAAAALDR